MGLFFAHQINYYRNEMSRFRDLAIYIVFASCIARGADLYQLFQNGRQVPNYSQIVQSLMANKTLHESKVFLGFSNGIRMRVVGYLGHGGFTAVFLRPDGKAIRIPLASGDAYFYDADGVRFNAGSYTNSLRNWVEAYLELRDTNATLSVYPTLSRLGEFVIQERAFPLFNVKDFFLGRDRLIQKGILKQEDIPLIEGKFLNLSRNFASYTRVADFKAENVIFSQGEWYLLDTALGSKKAHKFADPNVFEHRNMAKFLPEEIKIRIAQLTEYYRIQMPRFSKYSCSYFFM